jgi:hypothetical protein
MTDPPPPPSPPDGPRPPPDAPPPPPDWWAAAAPPPTGRPISVGFLFLGIVLVIPMSVAIVFGLYGQSPALVAGLFAGLVFIGGGGLCFVKSPTARGIGLGLMAGWAILSITTAGLCTGLSELSL